MMFRGRFVDFAAALAGVVFLAGCSGAHLIKNFQAEANADAEPQFELVRPPEAADANIIGGAPANPAQWPATWIFRSGNSGCTATIVGETAILTAAHCVADGAIGTIELSPVPVVVICSHHPRYATDSNFDVALCAASQVISNIRFENINIRSSEVTTGRAVTILGYGCLSQGGDMQSTLYVGSTNIISLKDSGVRLELGGGAQGCQGDSGGGGYVEFGSKPVIAGVMESVDFSNGRTYQVNTAHPGVLQFLRDWSVQNRAKLCGVHPDARRCRS